MTARRAVGALLALVAITVALVVGAGPAGADSDEAPEQPGRVLVFTVPGLTWADVADHDLPHLEAFFADAALAGLAPRSVRAGATPGDAYLTISAGARATTEESVDGQVLAVDEESSGSAAGEIFARRTGVQPDGPFVSLSWPVLVRANRAQPYDAEPGLLTDTLEEVGASAAAVGNADGTESIAPSYERQVGLAMADGDGVVPAGDLGKDLLVGDVAQPFGLRYDTAVVAERVAPLWAAAAPNDEHPGGGVVMVEASDTARVLRYRFTVDTQRYDRLWADALDATDELFGSLMAGVDMERDTVLVVAPYNRRGDRDLTAVALGGRGVEPGLVRSASTQRAGFLTLVDIAPTILDRLGITRPSAMEGRPAVVVPDSRGVTARVDHLVSLNAASRFRERLLTPTTTAVVVLLAIVVALGMVAHTSGWSRRARAAVAFLALWDLALLPSSFLARAFPLEEWGARFYWAFLLLSALLVAAGASLVGRTTGRSRLPLVLVLAVVAGVIVGDVVTGSHLSLGAAFGYSATGNSRLYGVSNYAYPQVAAAVCIIAGWVAAVRSDRVGRLGAVAVLVATTVVLGFPLWGSDVGGVLAFTPAVLVFGFLLWERRIRVRTVLIAGLATAAAITAFGLLDLSRPPGDRAHLGRLFERVGEEGFAPLLSLIERKLLANLQVSTSSLWVASIPIAAILWGYLVRFPTRPYDGMKATFPTLRAALVAALVAAVLGSLLNDSGAVVGGVAAMVLAASLVVLLTGVEPSTPADEGPMCADEDASG